MTQDAIRMLNGTTPKQAKWGWVLQRDVNSWNVSRVPAGFGASSRDFLYEKLLSSRMFHFFLSHTPSQPVNELIAFFDLRLLKKPAYRNRHRQIAIFLHIGIQKLFYDALWMQMSVYWHPFINWARNIDVSQSFSTDWNRTLNTLVRVHVLNVFRLSPCCIS